MARQRVEEVERFFVVNAQGDEYEVVVYQTFTAFLDVASGVTQWAKGAKSYLLPDDSTLRPTADGAFVETQSGRWFRRRKD